MQAEPMFSRPGEGRGRNYGATVCIMPSCLFSSALLRPTDWHCQPGAPPLLVLHHRQHQVRGLGGVSWGCGKSGEEPNIARVRGLCNFHLFRLLGMDSCETLMCNPVCNSSCRYGRPDASLAEVEAAAKAANAFDFITNLPDGFDTLVGEWEGRAGGRGCGTLVGRGAGDSGGSEAGGKG